MNKLEIYEDCVCWGGNQIGIIENGVVELGLTSEDFENGEFSQEEIDEVLANKNAIMDELALKGLEVQET